MTCQFEMFQRKLTCVNIGKHLQLVAWRVRGSKARACGGICPTVL